MSAMSRVRRSVGAQASTLLDEREFDAIFAAVQEAYAFNAS